MKNKRYWLLGGILGSLISIVLITNGDLSDIEKVFYFPAIVMYISLFGLDDDSFIKPFVIFSSYGFVVGAIIGLILQFFKKNK